MKKFFLLPLLVSSSVFAQPNPSGGPFPIPAFYYVSNETHTLQFIGTNTLFVAGGGDAGVNGSYLLNNTVGGITVWTNVAGTFGIAYDPGLNFFPSEQIITNSAGSIRYQATPATPFPKSGTWTVVNGTGPGPTVVVGTNTFTTNVAGYYPNPAIGPPGLVLNTNYYFVNPVNGNDTNAIPGNRDRPYQNFTNVIINYAVHTNDIVFLEAGTNYFGEFNIQVSNAVSIVGLASRDNCWLGKAASQVDVSDVALKPGIGSAFVNFSGNITIGPFGQANVTVQNLHTIGQVDNFLPTGASNYTADSCIFEVNAQDTQSLIDAGVIQGTGSGVTRNCVFISKRRSNGATTRRALVIKGGTNVVTGCTFIATDSTNNTANSFGCIGLSIEGSGYTQVSGCSSIVYNTNAFNFCAFTNAFNGSDPDTTLSIPSTLIYSNGVTWWAGHVIRTNFISGQFYTNVYTMPLQVSASITNVEAAVAGTTMHDLWVFWQGGANITGTTNSCGGQVLGTSLATTNSCYLGANVPVGYVWVFTNRSVGAGNASNPRWGQISF